MTSMTTEGLDPKPGLDQHFIDAAGSGGNRTGGFETAAQQIEFLDGMDREGQLQFNDEARVQSASDDLQTLHAYWRAGDAEAIWDEMGEEMRDRYPTQYRPINVKRNETLVPKIAKEL